MSEIIGVESSLFGGICLNDVDGKVDVGIHTDCTVSVASYLHAQIAKTHARSCCVGNWANNPLAEWHAETAPPAVNEGVT